MDLDPEHVACFIAEPIVGAGGVIVPSTGISTPNVGESVKNHDVLYISDEVVNGIWSASVTMVTSQDLFGFQPDILGHGQRYLLGLRTFGRHYGLRPHV